jgi:hypothetical protein
VEVLLHQSVDPPLQTFEDGERLVDATWRSTL